MTKIKVTQKPATPKSQELDNEPLRELVRILRELRDKTEQKEA